LDDCYAKEVNVSETLELVEQAEGEERDRGELGGSNIVALVVELLIPQRVVQVDHSLLLGNAFSVYV
jgi:hypothetical protein